MARRRGEHVRLCRPASVRLAGAAVALLLLAGLVAGSASARPAESAAGSGVRKPGVTLKVTIHRPARTKVRVTVRGPHGFRRQLTRSAKLTSIPAGQYTIRASVIRTARGIAYPARKKQQVVVAKGSPSRAVVDYPMLASPRLTRLSPSAVTRLTEADGSGRRTLETHQDFSVGDIVASGPARGVPHGLLARVKRAEHAGSTNSYVVAQARLDEAYPYAEFDTDFTVPIDLQSERNPARRGGLELSCAPNAPSSGFLLSASGGIDLGMSASWGGGNPSLTLTVTPHAEAALRAWAGSATDCSLEKQLFTRLFNPIIVPLPPPLPPLVIVPELTFVVGGELKTSASLSVGGDIGVSARLRATASTKGFSTSFTGPTLTSRAWLEHQARATSSAYAEGRLTALMYGVGGPYAAIRVGVEGSVDVSSSPLWKVDGFVQAGVGVELKKCVKVWMVDFCVKFDQGKPDVISKRWRIADAGTGGSPSPVDSLVAEVNVARATSRWCGQVYYPAVGALPVQEQLKTAAQKYATRMATQNFFDHYSPDGDGPTERAAAEGYTGPVSENIAGGQSTAASVVGAWLGSPGHCTVIMTALDAGMGYAHSSNSDYGHYWVMDARCGCSGRNREK